jgi:AHBA synthesis associated protein
MRRFNTIIFDLDGVIIDSLSVMKRAFQKAYYDVIGLGDPPFNAYISYSGVSFKRIMKILNLPEAMMKPYVEESNRLSHLVKVYPGIIEVLEALKLCKFNLGVATGKEGNRARHLLKMLDILNYFSLVIGGDEVIHSKPDPEGNLQVVYCS